MPNIQISKILRSWPAAAVATCLAIGLGSYSLWRSNATDDFQVSAKEACLMRAAGIQSWSNPREVRLNNLKSIIWAGKDGNNKTVEIYFTPHEKVRNVIVLSDADQNKFRGTGFLLTGNQGVTTVIANDIGRDTYRARTENNMTTYERTESHHDQINATPIEPDDKLRQTHAAALACMAHV